jgi:lipoprotein-releasing system permease protein
MNLSVNFEIIKTHLLARRRQTVVAMLGVTFGIGMFILLISFMKGMNGFFEHIMLSVTPDIHIYNDIKTDYTNSVTSRYFRDNRNKWIVVHHPKPKQTKMNLTNAAAIVEDLKLRSDVAAVSPFVSSQVLFNYGPIQLAASIDGVDITEEARIFDLAGKMKSGKPEDLLSSDNGIILGYKLAEKLNVATGDLVTATSPVGTQMRFRVVGTFQFGISTVDEIRAYVGMSSMQQMLGKSPDYVTDIRIKMRDMKAAPALAPQFEARYGYKAEDWQTVNASLEAGNFIRDVFTNVLTFTMLLVAGFGIYNIMNMIISGKMKDIAILKAQGFGKKDILQIFLYQSLIIGVLGATAGIIMGFGLSYGLSRVPWPEDDFVIISHFPVSFEIQYYILGGVYGVATTLVAGLMPALKASRIDPVRILRG